MPELPEVTTTVIGINRYAVGKVIKGIWSDYHLNSKVRNKQNLKNPKEFAKLKKEIVGKKLNKARRRGKYIILEFSGGLEMLVHMKMTGHFIFGKFKFNPKAIRDQWSALDDKSPLSDPYNRCIRFVFLFEDETHLAFSDTRRFANIKFSISKEGFDEDLLPLGLEPLEKLSLIEFKKRLLARPRSKIKQVLLDQRIIAGIGNIYSDEILFEARINPERVVSQISDLEFKKMFLAMKSILKRSIKMGGDSMSDYRNVLGEKGGFQNCHKAYRQTGKKCSLKNCKGVILRKVIGSRSSHFCSVHQK